MVSGEPYWNTDVITHIWTPWPIQRLEHHSTLRWSKWCFLGGHTPGDWQKGKRNRLDTLAIAVGYTLMANEAQMCVLVTDRGDIRKECNRFRLKQGTPSFLTLGGHFMTSSTNDLKQEANLSPQYNTKLGP